LLSRTSKPQEKVTETKEGMGKEVHGRIDVDVEAAQLAPRMEPCTRVLMTDWSTIEIRASEKRKV
jgi:hypothetical protein